MWVLGFMYILKQVKLIINKFSYILLYFCSIITCGYILILSNGNFWIQFYFTVIKQRVIYKPNCFKRCIIQDVRLDIMEETAQRNVTTVGTTLPVGYRMENVIIMGVLALDTSLRFVKVNLYLKTLCFSPFRDI